MFRRAFVEILRGAFKIVLFPFQDIVEHVVGIGEVGDVLLPEYLRHWRSSERRPVASSWVSLVRFSTSAVFSVSALLRAAISCLRSARAFSAIFFCSMASCSLFFAALSLRLAVRSCSWA